MSEPIIRPRYPGTLSNAGVQRQIIEAKIRDRHVARMRKDFVEADRLRNELADMGILIEDHKGATEWDVEVDYGPKLKRWMTKHRAVA